MHACALTEIQQPLGRQQLLCTQLDIDLSDLADCGGDEVAGHVRSFGQVCKVPAGSHTLFQAGAEQMHSAAISFVAVNSIFGPHFAENSSMSAGCCLMTSLVYAFNTSAKFGGTLICGMAELGHGQTKTSRLLLHSALIPAQHNTWVQLPFR